MTRTLHEMYQMEHEAYMLLEKIDEQEIADFASMFGQLDKILGGKNIPSLQEPLEKARAELADIQRDRGFLSTLATKGWAKALTPKSMRKAKTMANLMALQGLLAKFFRMLPNVMKVVGGGKKSVAAEVTRRLDGLIVEQDKRMQLGALAKQLGVDTKQLAKVAAELGQPLPKKGVRTQVIEPDLAKMIANKIQGNEPAEPGQAEPAQSEEDNQRASSLEAEFTPDQHQRFIDYVQQALSGEGGLLKSLLRGDQQPFGLNPKEVADDLAGLPASEFQDMITKSRGAKLKVGGMTSDDARDVADAVASAGGEKQEPIKSREQLATFLTKKFPTAKPTGLQALVKAIPAGTVVQ